MYGCNFIASMKWMARSCRLSVVWALVRAAHPLNCAFVTPHVSQQQAQKSSNYTTLIIVVAIFSCQTLHHYTSMHSTRQTSDKLTCRTLIWHFVKSLIATTVLEWVWNANNYRKIPAIIFQHIYLYTHRSIYINR